MIMNKKVIIISAIIAFVFGALFSIYNHNVSYKQKIFNIVNYDNEKYKVEFENDGIAVNGVKYYITYDELVANIKKSETEDFRYIQSIVSECIKENDGTYNKYDIYYTGKNPIIVFYKFRFELDDKYFAPSFEIVQLKNMLLKAGKWK